MLERIAALLGLNRRKDDALTKRFARIRRMYGDAHGEQQAISVVNAMRTGYNLRTVTGAQKTTSEQLRKNLLESYARTVEAAETAGKK